MIGNIECESSEEFVDKLDLAKDKGLSLALDFYCTCRNGRFEDDQLYAIYEKDDQTKESRMNLNFWIKGLPMPEGSEDMGLAGMLENPDTGEISLTFRDDVPEQIEKQLYQLPPNSILLNPEEAEDYEDPPGIP